MGYGNESMMGGVVGDAAGLATIPLQSVADKTSAYVLHPCTVHRICAMVTLAPTAVAAVVNLDRLPTPGAVAPQRTTIGSITIPIGTPAGKVVYKDIEPVDLDMGDTLTFALGVASTAGAAILAAILIPRAETPANQADAVKSV